MKTIYAKGLSRKEYFKEYRKNNRERYRKYSQNSNEKNLKEWRKKNPEKIRAIAERYYLKNKEKKKLKSKDWYLKNKEWAIERNRIWRSKNKEKVKVYRHNRENLIKKGVITNSINAENVKKLIKEQEDICALCLKPMNGEYTIDHIIPLIKGGHHEIYNIQLAHHNCNSMKQSKSTEKDTQKAIMNYLAYKNIFFYRQNSGAFKTEGGHFYRFGATGSPDIVCVINGQYVGIEVKDIKGKLSEGQKNFKERLEKAGGKYILARSLEDVLAIHR